MKKATNLPSTEEFGLQIDWCISAVCESDSLLACDVSHCLARWLKGRQLDCRRRSKMRSSKKFPFVPEKADSAIMTCDDRYRRDVVRSIDSVATGHKLLLLYKWL